MKKIDVSLVVANASFKLIPTILISAYLWNLWASTLTTIQTDIWWDVTVFTAGLAISFFLYSFNIRFSVSFLILAAVLFGIYKFIGTIDVGEFDTFYYSLSFFIYMIIFLTGWLIGFGFARFTYFPWFASAAVFLLAVYFIVGDILTLQGQMNAGIVSTPTEYLFAKPSVVHRLFVLLFMLFVPVLFYSIYIISINEVLRKLTVIDSPKFRLLFRRSFSIAVVLLLILLFPLAYVYFFGFPESLYDRLQDAQVNSANFLKKTYDQQTQQPQFDLQEYAQLLPEVKLSDETVFCTYIDNFFPLKDGGKMPLPVHFRRYVLNRYEPQNEKFVTDPYPPSSIPDDLFLPSIKDVPIGFSISDSAIETSTNSYAYRKNISAIVYNQSLAPDAYVAPNTGYFYQKLPVPPEDKETFTTVYQCSSLISIWNLPPFVYSSASPELVQFKEYRAEALRMDKSYQRFDSTFMAYYTEVDTTDTLIMNLAKQLTAGKETPYDKVQSVVDYFLGTDENGNPRFTYTLEPGSPRDINQSFMHYFLFENKKGYCTYFAGATTLLLRAAGIPCRVVVGYAIFDRSNKNSGWYWVYADQGHAWVEVYFPTYGWVDFDTTPTDDTEPVRPPKPDATPPEYAREPVFAVLGKLSGISADSTELLVRPYTIRYRSKEYNIPEENSRIITLKPAGPVVTIDNEKVKIGEFPIEKTMVLSAYSFDYGLEQIQPYKSKKTFMNWFVDKFPAKIPVDEAIIVYKEETEKGVIFAVDGIIESFLPDSSGLRIKPDKIFYRGKNYAMDARKAKPVNIRPDEAVIYIEGKKRNLKEFAVGDSMKISAESSDRALHEIKPFLAIESFTTWFKNRFPEIIPVDRIDLKVKQTPLSYKFLWGFLGITALVIFILILLATFVYLYFSLRIGYARGNKKLYWMYRFSLMLLNQLGFYRVIKTPLEYAHDTIDPRFGTQLGQFVNIYQKAKYAPVGIALSSSETQFVDQFENQFKRKVFGDYSRWDVVCNFANFIRTLRFLFVK
jgi:transglutaminase-like putative cysteine protease